MGRALMTYLRGERGELESSTVEFDDGLLLRRFCLPIWLRRGFY
jgi:hypothetical protein